MILEQNVFPGITNRLLSRIADVVGISFEEAKKYFPQNAQEKLIMVGNPVRKDIISTDRRKSRTRYNLKPVSYTHLDVYKRQVVECLANINFHFFQI